MLPDACPGSRLLRSHHSGSRAQQEQAPQEEARQEEARQEDAWQEEAWQEAAQPRADPGSPTVGFRPGSKVPSVNLRRRLWGEKPLAQAGAAAPSPARSGQQHLDFPTALSPTSSSFSVRPIPHCEVSEQPRPPPRSPKPPAPLGGPAPAADAAPPLRRRAGRERARLEPQRQGAPGWRRLGHG